MGKATGFMEYSRKVPFDRASNERIKDWSEFHFQLSEDELKTQGARCMDCGVPFCHMGILISGMASGCPLHNLIPEWNDLVYRGLWEEALYTLHKTNNFPEFTGRVCPAPCEGSCVLGLHELPVTIKNIEVAIIDRAFSEGLVHPIIPSHRSGKKVAIVGSGPAGLACAAQLNSVGHNVTVYEKEDRVGGLLMYGIPNMKLDKRTVLMRRIHLMEQEGIKFITNCTVGKDYSSDRLLSDYDAVVLCCGATKPRDLVIEGRNSPGIYFAVDYLTSNTKKTLDISSSESIYISAKGKNVIVIGGGDTGTDCVATALRQKCRSITQFEILPCPPKDRSQTNPWPEWPKIHSIDYGHREVIDTKGSDPRHYSIMTKKFETDMNGNCCAVHTVDVVWKKR